MTDDTRPDLPSTPTDDSLRQLSEYIEGSRWFGGKGRGLRVTGVRRLGVISEESPRVVVDLAEVTYDDGGVELYQVPLAFYTDPEHRLDHAFVGWWEDPDIGWTHAYDAIHDRDAMAAYLRAFAYPPDGPLEFHRLPGEALDATAPSTPFTGEQSNSSVAFGEQALLKVFRRVTPGHQSRHRDPREADPGRVGERRRAARVDRSAAELQLGMLQQFLRTASDGWELALTSVRNLFAEADLYADEVGGDFAAESQRLGEAVGEVHRLLAEHFPTSERTAGDHAELAKAMTERLEAALDVVPELAEHAPSLRDLFAAVGTVEAGPIQRVHGDLHLGQTLRTAKGWKIVDFEGEPAKPLSERVLPDSPWRDIAGMLRSFDYAPRVAAMTAAATGDEGAEQRAFRAAEWSARNQTAFLEAYAGRRADGRRADPARGVRRGQGRLRVRLRDSQPTRVAVDPAGRPESADAGHHRLRSGGPAMKQVPTSEIDQLTRGEHGQPHAILGPHPEGDAVTFRVFKPLARTVTVVTSDGTRVPLEHEHEGVWRRCGLETSQSGSAARTCRTIGSRSTTARARSPSTTPTGSCPPSARWTCTSSTRVDTSCCGRCSVPGSTTTERRPAMSPGRRSRSGLPARAAYASRGTSTAGTAASTRCASSARSGVWELFMPGVGAGVGYKYVVLGADGEWREKADPMAFWAEMPPATSSRVVRVHPRVGRRRVDAGAGRAATRGRADVDLRGASRLVAEAARQRADLGPARSTSWCRTSTTSASPTSS